jgi:UDP-N-acetylmuramate dehydrogenase
MDMPSAGSFFKRPPGAYAGELIERAGLKGAGVGGAQVSEKHAGFIVNTGNATAADVLALMAKVREAVREDSGYVLEPEPRIIGEDT